MTKDLDESAPTKWTTCIAQYGSAGAFLRKPLGVDTFKQTFAKISNS